MELRGSHAAEDQAAIRAESARSLAAATAELICVAGQTVAETRRLRERAQIQRRAARGTLERARSRGSEPGRAGPA